MGNLFKKQTRVVQSYPSTQRFLNQLREDRQLIIDKKISDDEIRYLYCEPKDTKIEDILQNIENILNNTEIGIEADRFGIKAIRINRR